MHKSSLKCFPHLQQDPPRFLSCGFAVYPEGIVSFSPEVARNENRSKQSTTPTANGVASISDRLNGPMQGSGRNPFRVLRRSVSLTQGSSFLATLGFGPESRWDSQT